MFCFGINNIKVLVSDRKCQRKGKAVPRVG